MNSRITEVGDKGSLHSSSVADECYRKIFVRLLPLLVVCYLFAFVDRTNVAFAKLQFTSKLGFSEAVYRLGAGFFYIGYALFQSENEQARGIRLRQKHHYLLLMRSPRGFERISLSRSYPQFFPPHDRWRSWQVTRYKLETKKVGPWLTLPIIYRDEMEYPLLNLPSKPTLQGDRTQRARWHWV